MDFALVSGSLSSLLVVMHTAFAVFAVICIACASAYLSSRLMPFAPADTDAMHRADVYAQTQYVLRVIRARRSHSIAFAYDETRPMVGDQTIPDLRMDDQIWSDRIRNHARSSIVEAERRYLNTAKVPSVATFPTVAVS